MTTSLMPQFASAGHAPLRRFDMRQQALEVAVEQALAEPLRHAVGKARRRAGLVGSEDPAQALFAQVIRLVRFAQHRELAPAALTIGFQLRRLVVDDVLVLDRNRRHVEPEQPAGLARVVAGRADDVLGDDVAFVRIQQPLAGAVRETAVTSVCS